MMRMRASWAALAAFLCACAVGPNYHRPAPPKASRGALIETGAAPATSGVPTSEVKGSTAPEVDHWWSLYSDPVLSDLIDQALRHNPDVRVAVANLREARAALSEARAGFWPQTQLNAQYSRARTGLGSIPTSSAAVTPAPVDGAGPQSVNYDFYSSAFDVSYELDLFGRVRRSVEAARGDAAAAAAALDASRIAIAAQTALGYIDACGFAAQLAAAKESTQLQARTVELTRALFDAGQSNRRDLDQAQAQYEQTAAQVPSIDAERRAALYSLATLTGRTPETFDRDLEKCVKPPTLTQTYPVGDGAALLARRPDVRRAERALSADTARIGVAVAELYPSISLLGEVSLGAQRPGDLGRARSFSYSIGPTISWTFPLQNAARARVRAARARTDASLATFDGAVLTALREAEQALARLSAQLQQNAALARAFAASDHAAVLSRARFKNGADSFLQLLDAERTRASASSSLAQSNQSLAESQINVFKALGGGWSQAPDTSRVVD